MQWIILFELFEEANNLLYLLSKFASDFDGHSLTIRNGDQFLGPSVADVEITIYSHNYFLSYVTVVCILHSVYEG